MKESKATGLGGEPRDQWPASPKRPAIEVLKPGSKEHDRVRDYLTRRLNYSEREMSNFSDRWRAAEVRAQGYIKKSDFEALLKSLNDKGEPPRPLNINVPYIFATLSSIVTYLMHTFVARRPMFVVDTNREEFVEASRLMEQLLQYNAEHEKLIKKFRQFFWDGELYGVGILRTEWRTKTAQRTVSVEKPRQALGIILPASLGTQTVEEVQEYLSFQGTSVENIEPQEFFPDPSVPMADVAEKGEYVFWRENLGKHMLLQQQKAGRVRYIHHIPEGAPAEHPVDSNRTLVSNSPSPNRAQSKDNNQVEVHFCSINLIPRELGIGPSEEVSKWVFAIANREQIIMAEELKQDHNLHPVVVSEPYTLGYELGQPSVADYLGPLQDLMSWFVNSHVHNVRTSMNNMFLYNPQMINENDIKNPAPGKGIRILPMAAGKDTQAYFRQLDVRDVTGAHMADLQNFTRIADVLSGVNDNLRGVEEPNSSRRTASEVRISAQSASSRLAEHAQLISSQAITSLTMMMCVNYQQYLSEEFYLRVVGEKGQRVPLAINRNSISGDFTFPVHDGTLPTDKTALVEAWEKIFQALTGDPLLRQQYDVGAVLEWIAREAGVKNLKDFKVNVTASADPAGQPISEIVGGLG